MALLCTQVPAIFAMVRIPLPPFGESRGVKSLLAGDTKGVSPLTSSVPEVKREGEEKGLLPILGSLLDIPMGG